MCCIMCASTKGCWVQKHVLNCRGAGCWVQKHVLNCRGAGCWVQKHVLNRRSAGCWVQKHVLNRGLWQRCCMCVVYSQAHSSGSTTRKTMMHARAVSDRPVSSSLSPDPPAYFVKSSAYCNNIKYYIYILLNITPRENTERPHAPSGVAAFMPAHSKTPYITP